MQSLDAYAVLNVDRMADADEIRRAYFAAVREHSPERDPEGFRRVREAYDRLRDEVKRGQVDLAVVSAPGAAPAPSASPLPTCAEVARLLRDGLLRGMSELDRTDFTDDERPLPDDPTSVQAAS
jgi:hypothetical protein